MGYERNVITIILFWLNYLVHNLDNCVITFPTKTGIRKDTEGYKEFYALGQQCSTVW